jgi:hypothetical protein
VTLARTANLPLMEQPGGISGLSGFRKTLDGSERAYIVRDQDGTFRNSPPPSSMGPHILGGLDIVRHPGKYVSIIAWYREDKTSFGGSTMRYKKVQAFGRSEPGGVSSSPDISSNSSSISSPLQCRITNQCASLRCMSPFWPKLPIEKCRASVAFRPKQTEASNLKLCLQCLL